MNHPAVIRKIRQQMAGISRLAGDSQALAAHAQWSGWSVAQHLDHTLRVCVSILTVVLEPPAQPGRGINLLGRAVLFLGYIPRGKGKAPEKMIGQQVDGDQLRELLANVETLLANIESAPDHPADRLVTRHPVFGWLTTSQSLRFAGIHTNHHLAIVRDILGTRR